MMKKQHDGLQADLTTVLNTDVNEGESVIELLLKFKNDLLGHLAVEDKIFYPAYLNELKEKGEDVSNTVAFIEEMGLIKDAVLVFLNKYGTTSDILKDVELFTSELKGIIQTLNIRIETEEEGVYEFYSVM